jgi:tetratricopeptide (TPR) repeat protein
VVCLTVGAVFTFDQISVVGATVIRPNPLAAPTADTLPGQEVATPAAPTPADYARFAAADSIWRARFAPPITIAELRARGDGKRTARELVQDRVFEYVKAQQRGQAIKELESWVRGHPEDSELLLALARLLNEEGRSLEAIGRYRQVLALTNKGE